MDGRAAPQAPESLAVELAARLGTRRPVVDADIPESPPTARDAPGRNGIALPDIPQRLIDSGDVAAIARLYTPAAMAALASILVDRDAPASAVAAAANTLIERGHGKAVATTVMANPDGSALFAGVEIVLVSPRARTLEHAADHADDSAASDADA
jgi:hypothetical protein